MARSNAAARTHTVLAGVAAVLALGLIAAAPAAAHPHVWVVAEATLLVENGAITAIRHRWVFDEGYAKMAVDGLDANADGKFDRGELAELAKVNVEGLKEFEYFTLPNLGTTKLATGEPTDYFLDHDAKGVLSLHFTLPLAKPVLPDAADFAITVGDPTSFIDFKFAPVDPVKLGAGAPAGCKAVLATPKAAAADAARLGQAFAGEMKGMVSIGLPQEIRIACGS